MGNRWKNAGGVGVGGFPEEAVGLRMQNRHSAAVAKGDIVMQDILNSAALSGATFTPGDVKSVYAGVVQPNTAGLAAGATCYVAEEAVGILAWGLFTRKSNYVLCSIEGALATALADVLQPQNATLTLDQNATTGATAHLPVIARVIEAQAAGVHTSAAVLTRCAFDGDGFTFPPHSA